MEKWIVEIWILFFIVILPNFNSSNAIAFNTIGPPKHWSFMWIFLHSGKVPFELVQLLTTQCKVFQRWSTRSREFNVYIRFNCEFIALNELHGFALYERVRSAYCSTMHIAHWLNFLYSSLSHFRSHMYVREIRKLFTLNLLTSTDPPIVGRLWRGRIAF